MTTRARFSAAAALLAMAAGCSSSTPATPTPAPSATTTSVPSASAVKLTAPAPSTPADGEQLTTLRPTLTVTNGSADQAGTRTYDFQISDRNDFALSASRLRTFTVVVNRQGVPEGTGGSTSITVDSDLQPTTRFYWRVRMSQGSVTTEWTSARMFKSQIVGFNRPGELYDPLFNGQTIAEFQNKVTTFVPGKGIQLAEQDSYVRYRLQQTVTNGEFSVDVEGLSGNPKSSIPDLEKLKIFSMTNTTGDIYTSPYLCNTQYRGFNGNPDHAISYKCLFGDNQGDHKLEPDAGARAVAVKILNPAATYNWKATWGSFFRLEVFDGGVGGVNGSGTGVGGQRIYDQSQTTSGVYAPGQHYVYLGVNNSSSETGSWPGAIYRNLWVADHGRPATLGNATLPN